MLLNVKQRFICTPSHIYSGLLYFNPWKNYCNQLFIPKYKISWCIGDRYSGHFLHFKFLEKLTENNFVVRNKFEV